MPVPDLQHKRENRTSVLAQTLEGRGGRGRGRAARTSGHGDGGLLFAPAVSHRPPFLDALKQQHQSSAMFPQKLRSGIFLPLTPSGFNTLVTVTDWKKERAAGCSAVWPAGGAII